MKRFRNVAMALVLLTLPLGAWQLLPGQEPPRLALAPQEGDLSGYYTCAGVEANGKKYQGVVTIERKNEVYVVQWSVGGSSFAGIGVRSADTVAVGWAAPGPAGQILKGVNLYRVEKGPRLVGRWTSLPGPGVAQAETLSFLKALDPED